MGILWQGPRIGRPVAAPAAMSRPPSEPSTQARTQSAWWTPWPSAARRAAVSELYPEKGHLPRSGAGKKCVGGSPGPLNRTLVLFVKSTDLLRKLPGDSRLKVLYFFLDFGTLPRGAVATAAQCAGVARPLERVARAVRGLLHARGAAWRVSPVPARPAERQSPEVDERDARARQRPGHVSSLSAFHHPCAVEADRVWRQLRAVVPERRGVLILDGTSFPKQGDARSASRGSTAARWARSPIARSR